jgi:hypothetical protein
MRRSDNRAALTDEVARFQSEVQRLAFAAIRAVLKQELDRRLAKLQPTRQRAASRGRPGSAVVPAPVRTRARPPAPPAGGPERVPRTRDTVRDTVTARDAVTARDTVTAVEPAAVKTREQPPDPPAGGRKRVPWTREAIINELASWMLSGTAIDATFVTRHGPPGLVAATRRVFGRFEAALNVAGLHVSKLYPDGPPTR